MKALTLNNGQSAIVDNESFHRLRRFNWHAVTSKKVNGNTYARRYDKSGVYVLMHREIVNAQKGDYVDHVDGDTLNNQKSNLRICTNSQNMMNVKKRTGTSSKYKGVTLSKKSNKWSATVKVKYKLIRLGEFTKEQEAAIAYNEAAKKYHGEFAYLNIV